MADQSTENRPSSSNDAAPTTDDVTTTGSDIKTRQRPVTSFSVDDAACDSHAEEDAFDDQPEANSWPVCTAARFLTSHAVGRRRHSELRSTFKQQRLVIHWTAVSFS